MCNETVWKCVKVFKNVPFLVKNVSKIGQKCKICVKIREKLKIAQKPCVFGELWRIGEFLGIIQEACSWMN